jgi:NADH:ubiquinone oxidoreductase subunit E
MEGNMQEEKLTNSGYQQTENLRDFEPEFRERPEGNVSCPSPPEEDPLYQELDEFIKNLAKEDGILIRVLHYAQNLFGYLSREVQIHIANRLGISLAEVYGVVSFYHYFSTKPKAETTLNVCLGTACYVNGSANILSELKKKLGIDVGEITPDRKFGLKSSRCIGACNMAPVMIIGEEIHGKIKPEMLSDILDPPKKPEEMH